MEMLVQEIPRSSAYAYAGDQQERQLHYIGELPHTFCGPFSRRW